jgi:glucose-6-phosphate isomerase
LEKWQNIAWLGNHSDIITQAVADLKENNIIDRLWQHDHTIWKESPDQITNRLGWLHSPKIMADALGEITKFVDQIRAAQFDRVVLLGMGGSSLAPEVFRLMFGVKAGYLDLRVLDNTDPAAVSDAAEFASQGKTLFVVSTKSGGTIETISFMKYFYGRMIAKHGKDAAGDYFVAITDPGSGLETMAQDLGFRKIFLNDPNIGGRFSALTYFGLVPAALVGIDISKVLKNAQTAADSARNLDSNAVYLGICLGALALQGIDKLTFFMSSKIRFFGAWIEQLIAESSGKDNKGIVPVDLEEPQAAQYYESDRIFCCIALKDDRTMRSVVSQFSTSGFPVIDLNLTNEYDIGAQFFNWEVAIAVACYFLKINPFDQPNVESAKKLAKERINTYVDTGETGSAGEAKSVNGFTIYGTFQSDNLSDIITEFLNQSNPGDSDGKGRSYIGLQAYLCPDQEIAAALRQLQSQIHMRTKLATTLGYGPRFLHSTGQLHKGDAGNGLFLQIIGYPEEDIAIPSEATSSESTFSFKILRQAQSLGDREALLQEGRKVLRIELPQNIIAGLNALLAAVNRKVQD